MYDNDNHEGKDDEGWVAIGICAILAIAIALACGDNTIEVLPSFQGI